MRTLLLMTVMALLAAGVGLGMGSDDTKDAAIKKGRRNLVGTWKLASCEAEGKKVPDEILKGEVVRWRINESTIISTVDGEGKGEDKYTLDPTTSPKAIDLTDKEGRRTPGIYLLEGDTLKVCLNEGGKERPREFASKPGTHLSVWVFKRVRSGCPGSCMSERRQCLLACLHRRRAAVVATQLAVHEPSGGISDSSARKGRLPRGNPQEALA
jgi:uncharacterized protein (TIGR03067 family)